jgi:hypothetical protein
VAGHVTRRAVIAVALALSACGGAERPRSTPAPRQTPTATATTKPVAIAPEDQAACTALYARLKRVTLAISSGSELITQAADKADLARRIATQKQQLQRSARLMDSAVVPAPLAASNRSLVKALRTFAGDFARALAPARRGDFGTAVQAMTDQATITRIVAAATKIQDACRP